MLVTQLCEGGKEEKEVEIKGKSIRLLLKIFNISMSLLICLCVCICLLCTFGITKYFKHNRLKFLLVMFV